jgi:hypothetical protein
MRLVERKSNRYKPSPSLPTTINCLWNNKVRWQHQSNMRCCSETETC